MFYFNAEIQNFIEYFYPRSFNFEADFKKISAEIPFGILESVIFISAFK